LSGLRVERVREFGNVYLGLSLWRRLGLHKLLARFLHHVMAALRNDPFCGDGEVFVQRRAKGCRKSGIRRHRG
jgi:hypothetical protein